MDKKYEEVMGRIEVTPEMHQRVLGNLQKIDLAEKKSAKVIAFSHWKRFAALAACLVVVLAGVFTLPNLLQTSDSPSDLVLGDGIIEATSAQELSEVIGFDVADLSALPFEIEETTYIAYWKDLAEIEYSGEGQTAIYRKGPGKEDVSGDYNLYAAKVSLSINGLSVELKGDGEDYTLATWTDETFSYSLCLSEGLSETEWRAILISMPANV